jgi:predicted nucleotidyltransferase
MLFEVEPPEKNAVILLVADNLDKIAALCREYRIQKLELFGSATTDDFDPESSDIDLIADLGEYELGVARRFFTFARALEELFSRKVDLLTPPMITNPYFRQAVNEQRVTIYEAGDREAAA